MGLGFDFTGRTMAAETVLTVGGSVIPVYDVVKGYAGIGELTLELLRQEFTKEEIALVYGGNFMRLFKITLH